MARPPQLRKKKVGKSVYWFTKAGGDTYFGNVKDVPAADAKRLFHQHVISLAGSPRPGKQKTLTAGEMIDIFLDGVQTNRSDRSYMTRRTHCFRFGALQGRGKKDRRPARRQGEGVGPGGVARPPGRQGSGPADSPARPDLDRARLELGDEAPVPHAPPAVAVGFAEEAVGGSVPRECPGGTPWVVVRAQGRSVCYRLALNFAASAFPGTVDHELRRLALGRESPVGLVFVPEGEEWRLPAGASRKCGGRPEQGSAMQPTRAYRKALTTAAIGRGGTRARSSGGDGRARQWVRGTPFAPWGRSAADTDQGATRALPRRPPASAQPGGEHGPATRRPRNRAVSTRSPP